MIIECASCKAQNRVPASRILSRARCGRCKSGLSPLSAPIPIQSEDDFDELVRDAPVPVVVDFWADWCSPCRIVAPELATLARDGAGRLVVAKVDTEAHPRLAARSAIRSIPAIVLFRGGRESKRIAGAMSAQRIASSLELSLAA